MTVRKLLKCGVTAFSFALLIGCNDKNEGLVGYYDSVPVMPAIERFEITPQTSRIGIDVEKEFVAELIFSDSTRQDVTNSVDVTWTSSFEDIAIVNQDGEVKGQSPGGTAIVATYTQDSLPRLVAVSDLEVVEDFIEPIVAIEVTPRSNVINVTDTQRLVAEAIPANGVPFNVSQREELFWRSSNEEIAVVDTNGIVTGIKDGQVVITAEGFQDGQVYEDSVDVSIIDSTNSAPKALEVEVIAALADINAVTLILSGTYFDVDDDEPGDHLYSWFKDGELIADASAFRYRFALDDTSLLTSTYKGCVTPVANTGILRGEERCAESKVEIQAPDDVIRPSADVEILLSSAPNFGITSSYKYKTNGSLFGEGESRSIWFIYSNGEEAFPDLQLCETAQFCMLDFTPELVGKFIQSCVIPIDSVGVFGSASCDSSYVVFPDDIVDLRLEQIAESDRLLISSRDDTGILADYGRQILATATLRDGRQVDVTNFVDFDVVSTLDAEFNSDYVGILRVYEEGRHSISAQLIISGIVVAEVDEPLNIEGTRAEKYSCATPTIMSDKGYRFHCPPVGHIALETIEVSTLVENIDYIIKENDSYHGQPSLYFSWEGTNKYCLNVADGDATRAMIVNAEPREQDMLFSGVVSNAVSSGENIQTVSYTEEALELQRLLTATLSRVDRVQPNVDSGFFDTELMLSWAIDWGSPLRAGENSIPENVYTNDDNVGLPPIVNTSNFGFGTFTADRRLIERASNRLVDITPIFSFTGSYDPLTGFPSPLPDKPDFYTTSIGNWERPIPASDPQQEPNDVNYLLAICVTPPET